MKVSCGPGVLAVCLATMSVAMGAGPDDLRYAFDRQGTRHTFTASFTVPATADRVLDLLYGFEHLQRFTRTSRTELLEQGPGWQRVRFTHTDWLWTMVATFRRELDRPARCVRFQMESVSRSGLPVPLPTDSSGDYCVEPAGAGCRVTYRQSGETDTSILLAAYMSYARREAILFARDLEAYVRADTP